MCATPTIERVVFLLGEESWGRSVGEQVAVESARTGEDVKTAAAVELVVRMNARLVAGKGMARSKGDASPTSSDNSNIIFMAKFE